MEAEAGGAGIVAEMEAEEEGGTGLGV